VRKVPPVVVDGEPVSSSRIRSLVLKGDLEHAARLLGRPFSVFGKVVRGAGRGRGLGFPTANLRTDNEMVPPNGVYATFVHVGDLVHRGITNIGVRPTFGGDTLAIETFLLTPLEDGDPQAIRVEFLRRVRDERKFESPEALKAQILKDAESHPSHT
jgi:riboflavin kinase/FMN adenylyltransferase